MAGAIPAALGRIFISYRREDTAYPAGWLYDRLTDRFAKGQVFKDIDSIKLGDDFVAVITTAVGSCDVLLALIGHEWLTVTDEHGRRRLDDPDDFVRLEIEAALARNVRVIPILVEGARMPRAVELPPSLAGLVRRQALELSPSRFEFDTGRLLKVLDDTLAEAQAQREAQAQHADAGRAAPGVSSVAPSEVSAGQPTAPPPPPRRRVFDQVLLLRRRPLLLGAGTAAVALVVVLLFKLFGGDEPPDRPLSVRGELATAGAVNSYPFPGRQGEQVYLDVQECASDGTLTWTLTAPDKEALFKDESLCIRGSVYDKGLLILPQKGNYQLTVRGDAAGSYRLQLWSVPAAQQFRVEIGDVIKQDRPTKGAGNIESPGAQDQYTFPAGEGQEVYLDVQECASDSSLTWKLLDADEQVVFEEESLCIRGSVYDKGLVTLPQKGDYQLTVQGSGDAAGSYHLKLWSVPTPQEFSLEIGGIVKQDRPTKGAGNIESPGAQDQYTFPARQGQQVNLDVQECASDGTLTWRLLGPDEEAVFEDESFCIRGSLFDKELLTLPQKGDYQLTVQGSGDATGTYRVKMQGR
jgi:TIR domain